ncbi:hypothetical protein F0L74_20775 [Chitinophaga agrisoli]|uniref:Uncharacterized protein n=1 Tax=Chitinophaga agrisoli TaxID=2607653 RepID=A0A5B2VK85_9BACT|nr:hypothetical protein [Chitinophaga agrisoli]KAA2238657.1 hypothetical protein F0L74_20775 [Chitinophaga agrisoli]
MDDVNNPYTYVGLNNHYYLKGLHILGVLNGSNTPNILNTPNVLNVANVPNVPNVPNVFNVLVPINMHRAIYRMMPQGSTKLYTTVMDSTNNPHYNYTGQNHRDPERPIAFFRAPISPYGILALPGRIQNGPWLARVPAAYLPNELPAAGAGRF